MVTVPFALYICAMASSEKMSSGNADTAFVIMNIIMWCVFKLPEYCVVFQCINGLHSIMELMLLWITKRLLKIECVYIPIMCVFVLLGSTSAGLAFCVTHIFD